MSEDGRGSEGGRVSEDKGRKPDQAKDIGVREFNVGFDDDGIRLDRWFKRHLPDTSFTTVAKWARTGQLRVDGSRATPGDRIVAGQILRVPPPEPTHVDEKPKRERPALSDDQTAFARDMVIHKDLQGLVLNKPPGLATQGGTKTHEHVDGLLDALQYEAEGRPKLVHRLDKDTSGALLVARTSRAAAFFAKAFSGRTARKVYWALIVDVPSIDDGMIELPIGKQPGTGGEKMHVDEENGAPARTRYRVIERAGNRAAWVELQPFTGRTHQLRVHMAAIGHPIVGDGKYGGAAAFLTGGISRKMHLHARRIRVDHPDGGTIDVTADLPTHFAESLKQLGFDEALGDALTLDEKTPPTREQQKQRARAHAKGIRKERRGERRGRGDKDRVTKR
ncbi:MAG: RluA family pseudouridine synthase [Sphingomonas bacterium]|nr:RluA family pseudouridine synthase [Sphingomonas bacterium]